MSNEQNNYIDAIRQTRAMSWDAKVALAEALDIWDTNHAEARLDLEERMAGTGHGIGSTDVNHVAMGGVEHDITMLIMARLDKINPAGKLKM